MPSSAIVAGELQDILREMYPGSPIGKGGGGAGEEVDEAELNPAALAVAVQSEGDSGSVNVTAEELPREQFPGFLRQLAANPRW